VVNIIVVQAEQSRTYTDIAILYCYVLSSMMYNIYVYRAVRAEQYSSRLEV
jgi:hypothetical protein